jgi:hypothetical protein
MADLMAFLFKPKQKTPHELACQLKSASLILLSHTKPASVKIRNRALEDASKALNQLKNIFIGTLGALMILVFNFCPCSMCRSGAGFGGGGRAVAGGLWTRITGDHL